MIANRGEGGQEKNEVCVCVFGERRENSWEGKHKGRGVIDSWRAEREQEQSLLSVTDHKAPTILH